ncbi:unnamed protein product, partial [Mesorhabditis spiculigera]
MGFPCAAKCQKAYDSRIFWQQSKNRSHPVFCFFVCYDGFLEGVGSERIAGRVDCMACKWERRTMKIPPGIKELVQHLEERHPAEFKQYDELRRAGLPWMNVDTRKIRRHSGSNALPAQSNHLDIVAVPKKQPIKTNAFLRKKQS